MTHLTPITQNIYYSPWRQPQTVPPLLELPTITPEEKFHDSLGSDGDADSIQGDSYREPSGWEDPDYSPQNPYLLRYPLIPMRTQKPPTPDCQPNQERMDGGQNLWTTAQK